MSDELFLNQGRIPTIFVSGTNIAEAWEKAVLATWKQGIDKRTEYDKKEDPPSKEITAIIEVLDPMSEPRIHRSFPAGLEELEVYRQEVVLGVHDHWIDPAAGKWTYTYHKRLFDYELRGRPPVDQIDYIINKSLDAFFSRRAQAITWMPTEDPQTDDPPCLQRIWTTIAMNEQGEPVLNMNSHWRSRDAYKAAFMDMFALTDLQRYIAEEIQQRSDWEKVHVGPYRDISDSFHIYGSYFKEFQGFLNLVEKRSFEDRTWNSEFAQSFFDEAREKIKKEQESK